MTRLEQAALAFLREHGDEIEWGLKNHGHPDLETLGRRVGELARSLIGAADFAEVVAEVKADGEALDRVNRGEARRGL